jgi:AcrR family transcriptional regulator
MATLADPPALASDDDRTGVLIGAASDLLEESGLEGLTIRAVLTRSGLARRAFYEQFGGKDDLVLAVFERTLNFAAEHFRLEATQAADPLGALRVIVTSLVVGQLGFGRGAATSRRSAALSREHLRLAESRPQDLQAALSPLLALIAEVIGDGIASGQMRACDPRLQASLVYNFVAATVHVELLAEEGGQPDLQRREQLSDAIWEFCRRAVIA